MPATSETQSGGQFDNHRGFTLAAHILFASFGSGAVLFNLDSRESHRLNLTGASVIGLLDGRHDISAIINSLARENGVQQDLIKADVVSFIEDLINRGWIDDQ